MLDEINNAHITADKVRKIFAKQPTRKKAHVFLDIETLDTVTTAAIWEIGIYAVIENEEGTLHNHKIFWTLVPIEPQMLMGFSQSDETLSWLSQQSTELISRLSIARSANENSTGDKVNDELYMLTNYLEKQLVINSGDVFIYSWGQFDVPILNHYLRRCEKLPLETIAHYRNHIDLRSVTSYLGLNLRPDTSAHNAVSDAQALFELWHTMRNMNIALQPSLDL